MSPHSQTISMYKDYFAFSEQPFSIVPDTRYLYLSGRHREALAHLLYGVETNGGFVLLTGDIGTGKTTVCRCLLENLPDNCDVAFIYNPKLTVSELLATICEEFGIHSFGADSSNKSLVDSINAYLLDGHGRGRKALLVIDEAQNLSADVLEQLRLLTNLETNERKLLQIILLGQPELQEILESKELRQLAQRIVARYHLKPLAKSEVAAYVKHRLTVAGSGRQLFPPATLRRVYQLSKGVPRLINLLCDRALLGAYVQGKSHVSNRILAQAAREVLGEKVVRAGRTRSIGSLAAASIALTCSAVLAIAYYQQNNVSVIPIDSQPTTTITAPITDSRFADYDQLVWPEQMERSNSESMAMATLFNLWGLNYRIRGGESFCSQAGSQEMSCLSDRGGLSDLRRLNLPAVLQLKDAHGGEFYAALTSLNDSTAVLAIGNGNIKEVPISALEKSWKGTYTILWRAPPDYHTPLKAGTKGKAVEWLRQQFANANGRHATAKTSPDFDADLARQVTEFQIAEGLPQQGIAGPLTLIRLTARTDVNAPRLMK